MKNHCTRCQMHTTKKKKKIELKTTRCNVTLIITALYMLPLIHKVNSNLNNTKNKLVLVIIGNFKILDENVAIKYLPILCSLR